MKKMIGITFLAGILAIITGCSPSSPSQSDQSTDTSSTTNSSTYEPIINSSTTNSERESAMEDMESVVISYEEDSTTLVVARKGNGNDVYRMFIEPEKLLDSNGNQVAAETLSEGTVVIVTYNGIIGYSYPAFIGNYTNIEVTDEDPDMETVASAKEALGGMASIDDGETETSE